MAAERHPIIANGELYVESVIKKSSPSKKSYPHEYAEAKTNLINDLEVIYDMFSTNSNSSDEIFIKDKVICFRLEPKFEAKSYVPETIISAVQDMKIIGGRQYSIDDETHAKLYFVKTTLNSVRELQNILKNGEKDDIQTWQHQVQSLHSVDLLSPNEKVLGFDDEWFEGSIEVVLHPLGDDVRDSIGAFFDTIKLPKEKAKVKVYEDGLTFINVMCNKKQLYDISHLNILRTIHPLGLIEIEPMRSDFKLFQAPVVEDTGKVSKIKVGVFDGGANENHPLLKNYVSNIEAASSEADEDCISHGTAVCGIVLHGCLTETPGHTLPTPCVSVNSYRVLPIKDKHDIDLYEVIDLIESVVPYESDTNLYNVSLGPKGAILDDCISRFTYALDRLTYKVENNGINPLFCIAVGNDGDLPFPYNRIQSPSDMVNGLAVGAYTFSNDGSKKKAYYSCIGEGREGAKIKPDILEFGGSSDHPFIVAANNKDGVSGKIGTSFSSPLVVHKIGELMAKSKNITPHMGRTLLIHSAEFNEQIPLVEQGFGFCTCDVENILTCEDNDVTILYSDTLHAANTVKLPVFAPQINNVSGNVEITWTIATIVDPCANDVDAYTNNCIEDTFYPNDMIFNFSKPGISGSKRLNLMDSQQKKKADELIKNGYKQSTLPVSKSAKRFASETDLRSNDLKWDTIIRKSQRMRGSSLSNPFITLHAMSRNDFEDINIKYFVAVQIKVPKYKGSLYNAILQENRNLSPIEIRNINRIMVTR